MLSRVAENLYWLSRYVERAENTARIVSVNANLLLDLPRGIAPGWKPLVEIIGGEVLFSHLYNDYNERSAVNFLVGDMRNPGSILSSLSLARENARTIRDIFQREAWELINELYLYAKDNAQTGISKRGRFTYLKHIIHGSQTLTGITSGTMNHNAGFHFMRLGALLERADMTTRLIDARSANLLPDEVASQRSFENIQWRSILKSLNAYQMYRQKMQVRVRRGDALRFLLQDDEFPRAFYRCIIAAESRVKKLPEHENVLRALTRTNRLVTKANIESLTENQEELHDFIDKLQLELAHVHEHIAEQYFLKATA